MLDEMLKSRGKSIPKRWSEMERSLKVYKDQRMKKERFLCKMILFLHIHTYRIYECIIFSYILFFFQQGNNDRFCL